MERKELQFNETAYKRHLAEYAATEKVLNDYINLLKRLIKGNFSKEEAQKRINKIDAEQAKISLLTGNWTKDGKALKGHIKEVVYDLLSEDSKLNGFQVDKQKAYELIQLPDNFIDEVVNFILANNIKNDPQIDFQVDLSKFQVKNGKIVKDPKLDAELKEQHSIFANNDKELSLYNSAKKMAEELEGLHKAGHIDVSVLHQMPFLKVTRAHESEPLKYRLNYDFVKQKG